LPPAEGWRANASRVQRIWRREGLRCYRDNLRRQNPDHGGSMQYIDHGLACDFVA